MEQSFNVEGLDATFYLIGALSAFSNRYQAQADRFFEDISWKQCFTLVCANMCSVPPTINELAEITGSSHQNVKQILLKLEKCGYVELTIDENDRRKQRIHITEKGNYFLNSHEDNSAQVMKLLFANVDPSHLAITIQTIEQINDNLNQKLEPEMKNLIIPQEKGKK